MKIRETMPGRTAYATAQEIAARAETPAAAAAPSAESEAPFDAHEAAQRLQTQLGDVRAHLGSAAVDALVQDLPKAALDALVALNPSLPLVPGQGAWVSLQRKRAQLFELERQVHAAFTALEGTIGEFVPYDYRSGDKAEALAAIALHDGREAGFSASQYSRPDDNRRVLNDADAHMAQWNARVRAAWPDARPEYLLRTRDGRGGTRHIRSMTIANSSRLDGSDAPPSAKADLRPLFPGYTRLAKEIVVLVDHLKNTAFPDAPAIATQRAEMSSENVPLRDLYRQAIAVIDEVRGLMHAREDAPARAAGNDGPPALAPAHHTVVVTPPLDDVPWSAIDGQRHIGTLEARVVVERLLSALRIYEGMKARDAESPHVAALADWMERSTFTFKTFSDGEPVDMCKLSMGTLRADVTSTGRALVTDDRRTLVADELATGPSRTAPAVRSITALSDL